ncbi:MAG: DUF1700 domain-containing protein [Oscillospiraceae bacterium]|nr:DUF1700 domain-containing protein [Oscillospiraceae bacterium]
MKNKESFLKELQGRLAVLEEAEQQDILAEYAQHIDLRVESGLTEEAAIRDFGDMDQLAAEILGAYHVKAAYQAPKEKKKLPSPWPALRRGGARAAAFFRRLGGRLSPRKLWKAVMTWWGKAEARFRLNEDFFEEPETADAAEENTVPTECAAGPPCFGAAENKEAAESMKEKKEAAWAAVSGFFRRLGGGIRRLCRGTARLVWNLFLLLCALPFIGLGLLALVCLGTLAVLLIQGYPLAGVTLCCLGGAACCAGVLGLGSGLVWRRSRPAVPAAAAEETALAVAETEREEMTADDTE